MAINGQAIKQDFSILAKPIKQETALAKKNNLVCCFEMPALAETIETSEYKNDKHSVIWFFNQLFTSASMFLQKSDGTDYVTVDELDSNTYGTFYEFGFFQNKYNEKAIGYQLKWRNVLLTWGEGDYQIKVSSTPAIGSEFVDYSFQFCLKEYTDERANYTTRFEWNRNGQFGDLIDDERNNDYGTLDFGNQLRMPKSFFGRPTQDQEKTFTKYASGAEIWTGDVRIEKYIWIGDLYPAFMHNYIMRNITAGDNIKVTDYNLQNPNTYLNKKVVYESNYAPNWDNTVDKARIEITFKQEFQNLVRKRD